MPRLRGPAGQTIEVPEGESIGHYLDRGFEVLDVGQEYAALKAEAAKPVDRGLIGSVNAAATSLLSGATLGLSDVVLSSLATEAERRQLFEDREANPIISAGANIVGSVAPALAAPGSLLGSAPAGIVGRASAAGFEAGRTAGGLAGTAQAIGATAAEGALQSAGAYLADTALADRKLSAEGLWGAIGLGGTFGGAAGGAMLGIERGTIAARRMFARTANADKAATEAEAAWQAAHQSTIEANDTAAEVARAQLARARLAREQTNLAKQQASAFEADVRSAATDIDAYRQQFAYDIAQRETQLQRLALPPGVDAPPPSPAKLQELAEAVAEHDAARIELDDLLRRLDAPEIEPGVASQVTVPRGQFDDLTQRGPLAQGTPVQVTTVGKKLADGTAPDVTTAFDSSELGLRFDPKSKTYHDPNRVAREVDKFAPLEPATGVFEQPSGLDDLVRMQREASQPTGLESLVDAQRAAGVGPPRQIPEYDAVRAIDGYLEQTLPASEISRRGYFEPPGGGSDPVRVEKARKIFEPGGIGQQEAVTLGVTPSGKIVVDNGRHRLAAAIEQDAPVKVKWFSSYEPGKNMVQRGADVDAFKHSEAMTDAEFQEFASSSMGRISNEERDAVARYSKASHSSINGALRRGSIDDLKPQFRDDIKNLDSVMSKSATPRDMVVMRGIKDPDVAAKFKAMGVGDEFTDNGYVSTSLANRPTDEFRGVDVEFRISVPKGSRATPVPTEGKAGERELLLDRGQRYRVDSMAFDPYEKKTIIRASLVAPEASDLESALRGTAAQLDSGKSLGRLSKESPAAAEYAANKLAKREADAQFFRDRATPPTGLEDIVRVQREAGQPTGLESLVDAQRAAGQASLSDDVTSAANVITKYERAAAKLTEALGPEAPPAAQQAAKAFRDAESAVDRKTIERTTRALDDQAEPPRPRGIKGGPTLSRSVPSSVFGDVPMPPTSKDMLDTARARKLDADAAFKRARTAEAEAKIGARRAKETANATRAAAEATRPAAPAPAGKSQLGTLAAAAGVADFADVFGIPGIPQPSDVPIIGPLLGVYLKYKALRYAAGRFTGRVAATGDSRAAALAARTKERIADAVDRTLGLVERAAPKSRGAAVAAATQLNARLFDDGEPDAPKNASVQELAAVRIREIAAAVSRPDLVAKQVAREFRGLSDPDLIAEAEAALWARFEYLNRVSPKAPPPNPFSKREWKPSPMAAHDLAQRLSVINDPASAFVDPTPAKAETIKAVYPSLLKMAQEWLIERVADTKHPVPYESRLRNSLLFDVPLDDSLQPDHAMILSTAHAPSPVTDAAPAQPGPQASIAANTNLSSVYQTGIERRAL